MSLFLKNNLIKTFGIKRVKGVSKIHQNNKKAFLVNLSLFTKSVIAGTFYDDFIKSYSNGITRDEVKQIMFKVLFSKNETPLPFTVCARTMLGFPFIFSALS